MSTERSRKSPDGAGRLARSLGLLWPLVALAAVLALARRSHTDEPPPVLEPVVIELREPAVEPDRITPFDDPAIQVWLAQDPLRHTIRGHVAWSSDGTNLYLRPWLRTDCWVPQPLARVDRIGRFEARLHFASLYDKPMVLRLELQDAASGQIHGGRDFYLGAPAGTAP